MHKTIDKLLKDLEEYGVEIDTKVGSYNYTKKCLIQAYLDGKLEGLKRAIKTIK